MAVRAHIDEDDPDFEAAVTSVTQRYEMTFELDKCLLDGTGSDGKSHWTHVCVLMRRIDDPSEVRRAHFEPGGDPPEWIDLPPGYAQHKAAVYLSAAYHYMMDTEHYERVSDYIMTDVACAICPRSLAWVERRVGKRARRWRLECACGYKEAFTR